VTSTSPTSGPSFLEPSFLEPTIAVLGEAVLDFTSTADAPLELHGHPGGSPLNTGVAAARMGQRVAALGQFSTDQFGAAIVKWLHENGVSTRWATFSDAPCAMAIVTATPSGAHFSFRGTGSADGLWDPQPRPVLPSLRGIQLSMMNCLAPIAAQTSADVLQAHRDHAIVLLDPTVRPALQPDGSVWRGLLDRFAPLAHIVKASDQDLSVVFPGQDPEAVAASMTVDGRIVILTLGGDGAILYRAGATPIRVAAPKVEVSDTIGAGDTVAGSLLSWLLDHGVASPNALAELTDDDWLAALRFAATAAAITCTRPGADPPTKAEVLALLG
jgi:fructokinase